MANSTLFIVDTREPVLKSWLRDGVSFGVLALTVWFANTQMPPSGWINFTLCTLWILWMVGKANRHKVAKTPEQAREWLDANYPSDRG